MFKKIITVILMIALVLTMSSCTYIKEKILNNEPLYDGGYFKNESDLNIVKDIGLLSYVDDYKPISGNTIFSSSLPSYYDKFDYTLFDDAGLQYKEIEQNVIFGGSMDYSDLEGITTFKGNNYRNSSSCGYPVISSQKLNLMWEYKTDAIDNFKGLGQTGQPAIVNWPIETQEYMNMYHSYKTSDGTIEVIFGSLDGQIHFIDLHTGNPTRDPINLGLPIYGSVTIDPRGYPLLYVGTGFNLNGQRYEDMQYYVVSLLTGEILYQINGSDEYATRTWGAFDSSPLIDKNNDTLIIASENGLIYNVTLNSKYDFKTGELEINPVLHKYYYSNPFGKNVGFESSPAAFKNYMYFTDNGGLIQCIDSTTMSPVWINDLKDDSDATITIDVIDENTVYLYAATEVSYDIENAFSHIYKFNALTGEMLWDKKFKTMYTDDFTTGITSTPQIGLSDISNLIFYVVTGLGDNGNSSTLIAADKSSGNTVWQNNDLSYTISSPTTVYDVDGKSYIVLCYSNGNVELIEGTTGKSLSTYTLDGIIESTPAIFNGILVTGTREGTIYSIKIN